jgi:glyoxylate/hydroxypyruvate reductase
MKSLRLEDHDIKFNYKPKVLVTHTDVPRAGITYLEQFCDVKICETNTREEIISKGKGCDAIFWATHEKLDGSVVDEIGTLKCLSTMSVGIDYVDVEALKSRKIPLGYTPNVLNDAVADIGMGLCIAASRRFHEGRLSEF